MKKWTRKGAAMFLAASMLFTNHIALAEELQDAPAELSLIHI